MTFAEKLKNARVEAGYTQNELANMLCVSRAAVAKWESGRGLPDIENLKTIAKVLGISVDRLLDDQTSLDLSVVKLDINLADFNEGKQPVGLQKAKVRERVVRETYPNAQIDALTVTEVKLTKPEKTTKFAFDLLTMAAFWVPMSGVQEAGKLANNLDKSYYLVHQEKEQLLVCVTNEQVISQVLPEKITDKRFEIGGIKFQKMSMRWKAEMS